MAKIRVWNSKVQKHHYIHPDLAKDKVFMQQRGMILAPEVKPTPQATAPVPPTQPVVEPSGPPHIIATPFPDTPPTVSKPSKSK